MELRIQLGQIYLREFLDNITLFLKVMVNMTLKNALTLFQILSMRIFIEKKENHMWSKQNQMAKQTKKQVLNHGTSMCIEMNQSFLIYSMVNLNQLSVAINVIEFPSHLILILCAKSLFLLSNMKQSKLTLFNMI